MIINLRGRIPSKKNSKIMVCRGRFPILLPSKAHKEWNEAQMWLLKGKTPPKPLEYVKIDITLIAPDKRATDLSNKAESIMDLLVDANYIKDDNWFCVPILNLRFDGVDKENCGAIVEITQLENR